MRSHGSSGVWELFIPEIRQNALYRYEIRNRASGQLLSKTDPYAQGYELRPGTAALATPANEHRWQDTEWMKQRGEWDWAARRDQRLRSPCRIMEAPPGWPLLHLPRTGHRPGSLRQGDGLYAHRTHAGFRASAG